MKPACPVARRGDYEFRVIEHQAGADFIRAQHYAKGCSKTGNMYGMFRGTVLVGVAQWLPPTRVCAESVFEYDWRRVISLTRVAVAPGEPQNATTMLVAASIKWIRSLRQANGRRKWLALVTFADDARGHTGQIYKATNWIEDGKTKPQARWVTPDGAQVATKAGPRTRTASEMRALGYLLEGYFWKYKFVMYLT